MQYFDRTIEHIKISDNPVELEGVFERCTFRACSLGMNIRSASTRIVIEGAILSDCVVDSVLVGPVVFQNCTIANLSILDQLWVRGAAFVNCVVKGNIGKVLVFEETEVLKPRDAQINSVFIEDNARIYQSIDWAIDISEATFDDLDIRNIPTELIRVNSTNQFKVHYQKLKIAYDSGSLAEAPDFDFIEACLETYEDSGNNFVIVANPANSDFAERMELLRLLKKRNLTFE